MLIKDVVSLAAQMLGIELSSEELEQETPTGEAATLLQCYHTVENEVALDYFPLKRTDAIEVKEGRADYAAFPQCPVDVCSVREMGSGCKLRFTILPLYLSVECGDGMAEITYTYTPEKRGWGAETAFPPKISDRLLALGVASEYCLRAYRFEESKLWGERYRDALRAAGILRRTLSVKSRRWV